MNKKILIIIFTVFFALLFSGCSSSKIPDLPVKSREVNFTQLNGEMISLSSLRGKTVAVGFWTLWCRRSARFLRRFDELATIMKNRQDVVFLAVNLDVESKYEKVVERIEEQLGSNLKHAFSGNAAADQAFILMYGDRALPHVLVVDPDGMIVAAGDDIGVVEDNV